MSEEGANLSPRTAAEYARFGQNVDEDKAKWASILAEKPVQRRSNANIDPESLATIMKLLAEDAAAEKLNRAPNVNLLQQAAAAASDPSALAVRRAAAVAAVKAEEAAGRAAAAAGRAAALAGARPVIVRRTLEQGDCFYSAVWRALSEQDLLGRVRECLGFDCTEEAACILNLRNMIADASREYIGNTYTTLYNLLASGVPGDRATFATIVSTTFTTWHQAVIRNSMMDPAAFVDQIVAGIRKPRAWASQIEVNTLTHILQNCHIDLEILTRYRPSLAPHRNARDVVSLYNPQGVHFEYFSFILPPPVARSPVAQSPAARSLPPAAQSPAARSPALPPPVRGPGASSPSSLLAAARARVASRSAAPSSSNAAYGPSATPGAKRPRGGKRSTRKRKHHN
jgi:hypothetical protein